MYATCRFERDGMERMDVAFRTERSQKSCLLFVAVTLAIVAIFWGSHVPFCDLENMIFVGQSWAYVGNCVLALKLVFGVSHT